MIPFNKRQLEFFCLNVFKNFLNVNTQLCITLILIVRFIDNEYFTNQI